MNNKFSNNNYNTSSNQNLRDFNNNRKDFDQIYGDILNHNLIRGKYFSRKYDVKSNDLNYVT